MVDTIRVMLVDDHAVVRSGLGAVLMASDELTLVGRPGTAKRPCACARR